jgi:hypothetical protein
MAAPLVLDYAQSKKFSSTAPLVQVSRDLPKARPKSPRISLKEHDSSGRRYLYVPERLISDGQAYQLAERRRAERYFRSI